MPKSVLTLLAGVAALLVVGLAVKRLVAPSAESGIPSSERLTAAADSARAGQTGWSARAGEGKVTDAGRHPGQSGSRSGTSERLRRAAEDEIERDTTRSDLPDSPGARYADAAGGRSRGSRNVKVGAGVETGTLPFDRARSRRDAAGGNSDGSSTVVNSASAEGDDNGGPKEDGLVLSLPLKETTDPDAGEKPALDQGVTFESADGAHFSGDAQFVIPNAGNLNGEAGTISFTMTPDWGGDDPDDASLVQLRGANTWENRLQIFKNGPYFRYLFTPDSGAESGVAVDTSRWAPGEPLNVAVTWGVEGADGQRMLELYINGQRVGQSPYLGQLQISPSAELRIGSDHPGAMAGARATISGFQAFNSALPQDRIAGLGPGGR